MKKIFLLIFSLTLNATTINELFEAVKKAPQTKIDNIFVKKLNTTKREIKNSLMPTISLTSSFTHYSIPTSIRPLPPTESAKLLKTNSSLPFSQNIARVGFSISMPLFVKEIYDNQKKISILLKSKNLQNRLNLLKREALIVGYVSNLNYLFNLKKALIKKESSIQETLSALNLGIENGVIPKFKLLRLKDKLNEISININEINSHINSLKSKIYALTKIEITPPIDFKILNFQKKDFYLLKILKNNLSASKENLEVKKDVFYPRVILKINGNRAFAKSYNTKANIALNYLSGGIYLKWDIFNKKNNAEIQKAKLELLQNSYQIEKTKQELFAKSKELQRNINLIDDSLLKIKQNIELKEELLKGAKVAFKLNRMSVDEYLGYEDALYFERANLFKLKALKNEYLMNLAVIYGINIERICK